MKICVYGCGVVGDAYVQAYKAKHDVFEYDLKYSSTYSELVKFNPDIIYLCLPTPSREDGSCDISIIEDVVGKLSGLNTCIVIKSTVPPGTCDNLVDKFDLNTDYIGHNPEFLKERSAHSDALSQKVLAIGTYGDTICRQRICESNKGLVVGKTMFLTPSESEMVKYYHNCFNAARIIFSNTFYEMCESLGISYDLVKQTAVLSNQLKDEYHDVHPDLRGFGGVCLPKDSSSIVHTGKQLGVDMSLIEAYIRINSQLDTTVFEGMRKQ